MASIEGILSPFPTQPSPRSLKVHTCESLFLLNQSVDHVVTILWSMDKLPFANNESLSCASGLATSLYGFVYLGAEKRERETAPCAGIIPHSAVALEEARRGGARTKENVCQEVSKANSQDREERHD